MYVYLMSLIKCFVKKKGLNDGFKIIYTVTLSQEKTEMPYAFIG